MFQKSKSMNYMTFELHKLHERNKVIQFKIVKNK